MELVYLWVEEYKNIKKQGFNFSPRFNCYYDDETNELTISENKKDNYIDGFFGENINVTAIVGKNGSGKSSLLELILHIEHWYSTDTKLFFIVKGDDGFVLHHLNFSSDIECKKTPLKIKQEWINRGKQHGDMPIQSIGIHFVYLSLSPFLHNINTFYSQGSFNFFSIYNYHAENQNTSFNFDDFFLTLVPKIMDILNHKSVREFFEISAKPTCLAFKLNKEMEKIYPDEVSEVLKKSIEMPSYKDKYFRYISSNDLSSFENIKKLQEKIQQEQKRLLDAIRDNKDDEHPSQKMNRMASTRIRSNKNKLEKIESKIKKLGAIRFYFAQNETSKETFFFSSGELILLYYIDKFLEINSKENNLTILIDESELHMHPDWQKKFMNLLLDLLNHKEYKRDIIITSHSPFLLSDIPKQNIIFLDKDQNGNCKVVDGLNEKKQTFGANIHTLLSDSFFMEDGLMGEFAQKKINALIDYLNGKQSPIKDDEKAQQLINIIGEPIVKNQLQRMLDSKRLSKVDKIDKIEEDIHNLQQELKGLKDGQK